MPVAGPVVNAESTKYKSGTIVPAFLKRVSELTTGPGMTLLPAPFPGICPGQGFFRMAKTVVPQGISGFDSLVSCEDASIMLRPNQIEDGNHEESHVEHAPYPQGRYVHHGREIGYLPRASPERWGWQG